MSLNRVIKKTIELYPQNYSTRSEALLYLFCSKNTYKWVNGQLVSKSEAAKKKTTSSYKLPFEASRLIENMKRVSKKQAVEMEKKYTKAHKRDMDRVKKTLEELPKRVKSRALPRKVDTFYSQAPIFKLPKNAKPEWIAAAVEVVNYTLKKDPTHKQALALKESLLNGEVSDSSGTQSK